MPPVSVCHPIPFLLRDVGSEIQRGLRTLSTIDILWGRALSVCFLRNQAALSQHSWGQAESRWLQSAAVSPKCFPPFCKLCFLKFNDKAPENSSVCEGTVHLPTVNTNLSSKDGKNENTTNSPGHCWVCHSSFQGLCFSGGKACFLLFLNLSSSQTEKMRRCGDLNGNDWPAHPQRILTRKLKLLPVFASVIALSCRSNSWSLRD